MHIIIYQDSVAEANVSVTNKADFIFDLVNGIASVFLLQNGHILFFRSYKVHFKGLINGCCTSEIQLYLRYGYVRSATTQSE